jgi:hypothetical protein
MKPLNDYFYRFPSDQLQMPGRCRVRIYKRKNGTHAVVLTELNSNSGESITTACERIVTGLVSTKGLNPKSTRWIQHDPPHDDQPHLFDELQFTWDDDNTAHDPQWARLDDEQVETLTGDGMDALNRRLGDFEIQVDEGGEYGETETEGTA